MAVNPLLHDKGTHPEKSADRECTGAFTVVVGADGFVGGCLAAALGAERIVYGPCGRGDIHISQADVLLKKADVVINAGGFRVRPGCTYADYQHSHQGATSVIVPWIRKGALLLHLSSASVLGKSQDQALGNQAPPNPASFPSVAYALAKLEADQFLEKAATEREFRLIFVRPAVIYGPHGAGMIETLLKLAKRGIILRLYPRNARHHLCHTTLLVDVVRRILAMSHLRHLSRLVVADPYTVTNRQLEMMLRQYLPRKGTTLRIPVPLISTLLRYSFHSRNPRLDMRTWGEIFGVLNLDTAYDPSETFGLLGLDPAQYSLEKTLQPSIREGLQP
jgi:nucleoside-diphosphate-sugar epimerase